MNSNDFLALDAERADVIKFSLDSYFDILESLLQDAILEKNASMIANYSKQLAACAGVLNDLELFNYYKQ